MLLKNQILKQEKHMFKVSGWFVGLAILFYVALVPINVRGLQGAGADIQGEYFLHLTTSAELINLAIAHSAITGEENRQLVRRFRDARNAQQVLRVQNDLLRILALESVDYSDILYLNGVVDRENYRALKENLRLRVH